MVSSVSGIAASEEISIHPPERLLFGPGPTQVHPRVYEAMAQPVVGHLDPYFFEISNQNEGMLRNVFGTKNPLTFVISGTGSGGMETAITNFVDAQTKVAVLANGYFCDRMTEMAKRQGANVVRLEKPWGEFFGADEVSEFIRREKPQVVMYVMAETSTGVFERGEAFCEAAHEAGAIVIADCVTSLGAMPVEIDRTGIDVSYSCTQKGLSCPPGLSPITVSPRAADLLKQRESPPRTWYFDIGLIADYLLESHRYHHTASATMFYALHEGLTLIEEEGVAERCNRHHRAHHQFVKTVERMGLQMLVPEGHRIWNLNTVRVPAGVDEAKVRATLLDEHGIEIAGGFGPLAGKIFRIGIMGPLATPEHVDDFLKKFSDALGQAGYKG
jgi:alanine-glyoxylate transaminase/serine-glyoxylate transaminase/serine-pyruvate transaminase